MLDTRTLFVSIMAANNEIGVLQPLADIAGLCRSMGALFHTDATQAAGRIGIDVNAWNVDLLSLSAHKVYGPKGVGSLFARAGVRLEPIVTGGGQERGLRPGTVPASLAVGFGEACRIALEQWREDACRMAALTMRFRKGLQDAGSRVRFFGHLQQRLPGSLCVGFPDIPASQVIASVSDRVAVSTGSACTSGKTEASKVLLALNLEPDIAATGVRVQSGGVSRANGRSKPHLRPSPTLLPSPTEDSGMAHSSPDLKASKTRDGDLLSSQSKKAAQHIGEAPRLDEYDTSALASPEHRPRNLSRAFWHMAISTGSACNPSNSGSSKALIPLGSDPNIATTTLQLGLGQLDSERNHNEAPPTFTLSSQKLNGKLVR